MSDSIRDFLTADASAFEEETALNLSLERHQALHAEWMAEHPIPPINSIFIQKTKFKATQADNELFRIWDEFHASPYYFSHRQLACRDYAWAVPTNEVLAVLCKESNNRIIEIGSGTGYWAQLLRDRGCNVTALETCEEDTLPRYIGDTIIQDGPQYLKEHGGCPTDMLFICWAREDYAQLSLDNYAGQKVAVIGEPAGGCTWSLGWEEKNLETWEQVLEVNIPQWFGMDDTLQVYCRKTAK